ncbi:hypothetical protein RDABS01_011804 [Bienertia sinuspersici]
MANFLFYAQAPRGSFCHKERNGSTNIKKVLENGEDAWAIFEQLIGDGHIPSLITYTTLLESLSILKRFEFIHPIISQVEKNGIEPDSVFLNAVINAYAESRNMKEAKKAFVKKRNNGYRPSTSTYNTLIKGFGIAGQPEESLKLLKQMPINPISGHTMYWCSKGNMAQAWNVINNMMASGLQPETIYVLEMLGNNVQPNERCSYIIASGYCRDGKLRDALRFVYKMKEVEEHPNLADITDMDGVNKVEILFLQEINAEEYPVASTEDEYQKQLPASSYSDMSLAPNGIAGDFKGSAFRANKSRLVLGDASESPCNSAAKTIKFGGRPPTICQKQSNGQLGLYSHLALSCTLVFLN